MMACHDLRRANISSGFNSFYSLLDIAAIVMQPLIIRTTAVKSYFQTHSSSNSHMERNRLPTMAREAFAAKRVKSTYGNAQM